MATTTALLTTKRTACESASEVSSSVFQPRDPGFL